MAGELEKKKKEILLTSVYYNFKIYSKNWSKSKRITLEVFILLVYDCFGNIPTIPKPIYDVKLINTY